MWLSAAGGLTLAFVGLWLAVRYRNTPWFGTRFGKMVAAIALLAFFAILALSSLDGLLARMHLPGSADLGLDSITGPGAGADQERVAELLNRWANWYHSARADFVARPSVVLWVHLLIDSLLFVPLYIAFLGMVRMRSAMLEPRWLDPAYVYTGPEGKPPAAWTGFGQRMRRIGFPAVVATADVTENLLVEHGVRLPLVEALKPDGVVSVSNGLVWALKFATVTKWVFLLLLVINTLPALAAGLRARIRPLEAVT
jgi:hypothetical protein